MKITVKLLAFLMACIIISASFAACSKKRILVIDDYASGSAASDDASVDPSDETTAYIGQTPGGSTSSSGKINGTYGNETMPDDITVTWKCRTFTRRRERLSRPLIILNQGMLPSSINLPTATDFRCYMRKKTVLKNIRIWW